MALSPLEIISQDLDWREAELGSLKLLLARKDTTEHQRIVLLRACWTLLYAHYEGFVKTALSVFFERAKVQARDCGSLPQITRLFALETRLRQIRNLPSPDLLAQIETFPITYYSVQPDFPDVDTKSNLWPNVLETLLKAADIHLPILEEHSILIKTLVARRNSIAHGSQELIQEIAYYRSFESAVYDLMYQLAFGIDERLRRAPYA